MNGAPLERQVPPSQPRKPPPTAASGPLAARRGSPTLTLSARPFQPVPSNQPRIGPTRPARDVADPVQRSPIAGDHLDDDDNSTDIAQPDRTSLPSDHPFQGCDAPSPAAIDARIARNPRHKSRPLGQDLHADFFIEIDVFFGPSCRSAHPPPRHATAVAAEPSVGPAFQSVKTGQKTCPTVLGQALMWKR